MEYPRQLAGTRNLRAGPFQPHTKPFENALTQFHGKTIIPLCFGAFGEVNEDLDKVIQCLAREAASSDEGLTISPLVNTDRKGGAYRIMLQQFRRAIAVTAANGHSQHILQRLHYVRGTEQEAPPPRAHLGLFLRE